MFVLRLDLPGMQGCLGGLAHDLSHRDLHSILG